MSEFVISMHGESTYRGYHDSTDHITPPAEPVPAPPPYTSTQGFHIFLAPNDGSSIFNALVTSFGSTVTILNKAASSVGLAYQTTDFPDGNGSLTARGIAATRSSMLIINLGINDAANINFLSQLSSVVRIARRQGRIVVLQKPNLVTSTDPVQGSTITYASGTTINAGHIQTISNNYPRTFLEGARAVGTEDGIHPNLAAYQSMATALSNLLTPQLTGLRNRVTISRLYVMMFNRAAENGGLNYWADRITNGETEAQVADAIYAIPAVREIYPAGISNADLVDKMYLNILGRPGDAEGKAYWTGLLNAGTVTVGGFMMQVIEALVSPTAYACDAAYFRAKYSIGMAYGFTFGYFLQPADPLHFAGIAQNSQSVLTNPTSIQNLVNSINDSVSIIANNYGFAS